MNKRKEEGKQEVMKERKRRNEGEEGMIKGREDFFISWLWRKSTYSGIPVVGSRYQGMLAFIVP